MTRQTTRCPDLGQWRAWLDREAGIELADAGLHLAECPACRTLVAEARSSADLTASALAVMGPAGLPAPAEVSFARQRLEASRARVPVVPALTTSTPAPAHMEKPPMPITASFSRWRVALGGLAAALLLSLALATPQGGAFASGFLGLFRSQNFTVVTVSTQDAHSSLLELGRLGTVTQSNPEASRPRSASSLSEASARVGFTLVQPDPGTLPSGMSPQAKINTLGGEDITFTFDKAKAQAYYQSIGRAGVSLPDRFNGASLIVHVPTAALLQYAAPVSDKASTGLPALVVGESTMLTVETRGNVSLDEMRSFLLSLPDLPTDTRQQLERIQDWQNTLPIPVPAEMLTSQQATLGSGQLRGQGVILSDKSNVGSGLLWQANGRVYGVAGTLSVDQLKNIANGLR